MNLKSALVASAAASALMCGTAAQGGTYISIFGGLSTLEPDSLQYTAGPFTYPANSLVLTSSNYTATFPLTGTAAKTRRFRTTSRGQSLWVGLYLTYIHRYSKSVINYESVSLNFAEGDFDTGFVIGASLGYAFDIGLRPEVEFSWRQHSIGGNQQFDDGPNRRRQRTTSFVWRGDAYYFASQSLPDVGYFRNTNTTNTATPHPVYLTGTGSSPNPGYVRTVSNTFFTSQKTVYGVAHTDGDLTTFAIMANLWYDFSLGRDVPVRPFIGGGFGMANIKLDYRGTLELPDTPSATSSAAPNSVLIATSTESWVSAWQAGGGIIFDVGEGMSLSAQYRYFATGDINLPGGGTVGVQSHMGLIGFTFDLGR